jgi:signal transduction histidine kinase
VTASPLRHLAAPRHPRRAPAPLVVAAAAAAGSAAVIVSCRRALGRAGQRRFDLELDAATAEVRHRLGVAQARTRRHDLANAITVVEGAATILAREHLRPADRSTLTEVLESGLSRVRRLLGRETAPDVADLILAEAAAAATKEPPWSERVELDVAFDLVARGSVGETTETIRQLLSYAHQRAPAYPVLVRGQRAGARVVVWVEDRGPAMSPRHRRAILEFDRRPTRSPNIVTPLDVAIRLAREQGGDIRIEHRHGGGLSFGLCLPAGAPLEPDLDKAG